MLAAVSSELAGTYTCPPDGWHVRCTGVGAIAASIATTRLLITLKPSKVLFVGTCGFYDKSFLSLGDFLKVSSVVSVSLDFLEGRSYRPVIELNSWLATLSLPTVHFPTVSVAVTPGVTATYYGAKLLSSVASVENLELTGIFAACHEANVPCGAILAVANQVGPEAHAQWQANHKLVSSRLMDTLKNNGIFDIL
jgi:purine-nucleoside phosphorylase